ncbi:MAG: endolytic transglycosylase MltG [Clostridiaceae bacterium]|nr:endolytic transglycosylase MltG [Clostridiaceae bacterium]
MSKRLTFKRRNRKILPKFISLILVLILGFGTVLFMFYNQNYQGRDNGERVTLTIPEGASLATISRILKENGVIRSERAFLFAAKLEKAYQNMKSGTHTLTKDMPYDKIFEVLSNSAQDNGETVKVTIPEGFELRQIADRLEEKGLINKEVFYDVMENEEFDFFVDIPRRENRFEGYLFPETYIFKKDAGEKYIIQTMLSQFEKVFNEEYRKRAQELGMTVDQVVTLASIIEREALGDEDRDLISSVFHNRLKVKSPEYLQYLQSCATIQYILKERKPVISVADTIIDSPYNTYMYKGLPIGPISSPGEKAIRAALYPAQSDYYFFKLNQDNKHVFSKTYQEHQRVK